MLDFKANHKVMEHFEHLFSFSRGFVIYSLPFNNNNNNKSNLYSAIRH